MAVKWLRLCGSFDEVTTTRMFVCVVGTFNKQQCNHAGNGQSLSFLLTWYPEINTALISFPFNPARVYTEQLWFIVFRKNLTFNISQLRQLFSVVETTKPETQNLPSHFLLSPLCLPPVQLFSLHPHFPCETKQKKLITCNIWSNIYFCSFLCNCSPNCTTVLRYYSSLDSCTHSNMLFP